MEIYKEVPVCERCETKYGRDAFPEEGTRYQSDGAENVKRNVYDEKP